MNLSKIKNPLIKREVEIEGEKLEYKIKTKFLTPQFMQSIKEYETQVDFLGIAKALSSAIPEWNMVVELEDKTKAAYPPTVENIANLDMELVLNPILNDITKVFTDAEKRQQKSANTSGA